MTDQFLNDYVLRYCPVDDVEYVVNDLRIGILICIHSFFKKNFKLAGMSFPKKSQFLHTRIPT